MSHLHIKWEAPLKRQMTCTCDGLTVSQSIVTLCVCTGSRITLRFTRWIFMTIEFKSFPRSENKEHFFPVSALFFAVREFCYAKNTTVR